MNAEYFLAGCYILFWPLFLWTCKLIHDNFTLQAFSTDDIDGVLIPLIITWIALSVLFTPIMLMFICYMCFRRVFIWSVQKIGA